MGVMALKGERNTTTALSSLRAGGVKSEGKPRGICFAELRIQYRFPALPRELVAADWEQAIEEVNFDETIRFQRQ